MQLGIYLFKYKYWKSVRFFNGEGREIFRFLQGFRESYRFYTSWGDETSDEK